MSDFTKEGAQNALDAASEMFDGLAKTRRAGYLGHLNEISLFIERARGWAPNADDPERPIIVCLCGSTRFIEAFREANLRETMEGHIVLSVGCNTKSDAELLTGKHGGELGALKARLDELHKRKIDLADEILVLNVGGYVGESTRSEIEYAQAKGKGIRFLETVDPAYFFEGEFEPDPANRKVVTHPPIADDEPSPQSAWEG